MGGPTPATASANPSHHRAETMNSNPKPQPGSQTAPVRSCHSALPTNMSLKHPLHMLTGNAHHAPHAKVGNLRFPQALPRRTRCVATTSNTRASQAHTFHVKAPSLHRVYAAVNAPFAKTTK